MKILFLGDYSNLHACLAKELRRRGHEVTVVSDRGTYMRTDADVELRRKPGMPGAIAYLWKIMASLPSWKGYDAVQLINPGFLKLRCGKLRIIFDILKKNNRSVFLTMCGDDHFFVKDCVEGKLFRFSEYRIGNEKTDMVKSDPWREQGWLLDEHRRYTRHLYDSIDGAMSVLPEYDMSARLHMDPEKLAFTNLPVELDCLPYEKMDDIRGRIRILVGIRGGMEVQKGTAHLLELCREVEKEMPEKIEVKTVSNLSLSDYIEELKRSHIVIDQLYSYSPATNALQAMALGRVAATGGQDEYYEYLRESTRPVLCLSPDKSDDEIKLMIKKLASDPDRLKQMSEEGRRIVESHNDVRIVADRYESHWKKCLRNGRN